MQTQHCTALLQSAYKKKRCLEAPQLFQKYVQAVFTAGCVIWRSFLTLVCQTRCYSRNLPLVLPLADWTSSQQVLVQQGMSGPNVQEQEKSPARSLCGRKLFLSDCFHSKCLLSLASLVLPPPNQNLVCLKQGVRTFPLGWLFS